VEDGVATVTLNRPDVYNAFNIRMQRELKSVWRSLRDDTSVRVVVLTGAGEKAFCTGIDRFEAIESSYLQDPEGPRYAGPASTGFMYNDPGANICPKTNDLWKPVIAAVNGMACGGALYMLGEADIIIAAENATFFDPHVTYGMVASFESVHLYQKLPLGEALRVQLLGAHERMSAQRAHQVGLVSEVVPADELMEKAMWAARAIASQPPLAVQGTLRSVWMANDLARREALAQVSSFVVIGTEFANIEEGEQTYQAARPEWRLR
jgi:enoyl-CoA hydratase/carnithine racemase